MCIPWTVEKPSYYIIGEQYKNVKKEHVGCWYSKFLLFFLISYLVILSNENMEEFKILSCNYAFVYLLVHLSAFASAIFFKLYFYFMCMIQSLPACIYVYYEHAWCLRRLEEGIWYPETRLTDGCDILFGFQELNSVFCASALNNCNCCAVFAARLWNFSSVDCDIHV